MDDNAELISYNTFTFKTEAQMLLRIKYWEDEGEKVFKILKNKGCIRFCYSRIWNKKGTYKTSVLYEYENSKAFRDCQAELAKMRDKVVKDLKSIDIVIEASRNIVLQDLI